MNEILLWKTQSKKSIKHLEIWKGNKNLLTSGLTTRFHKMLAEFLRKTTKKQDHLHELTVKL